MTRLQIDLVDMRTRPDKIASDVVFNWILNCIDHFSKFCWAFPLKSKSAVDVAVKLRELFFVFGPPRLLHSDNGKEFVASFIIELKELFPDLCFIRGRLRHPQSQGCIERANGVLCDALGKWLTANNTSHWSEGLVPVVYGINTRVSSTTKKTPYEVMFGQSSRLNSEFWRLVDRNNIVDEDDLPTPVDNMDDTVVDKKDDTVDLVDSDVIPLIEKLTDDVVPNSITNLLPLNYNMADFASASVINNSFTNDLISFDSPEKDTIDSNSEYNSNINTNNLLNCLQDADSLLKCSNTDFASSSLTVSEPQAQSAISILNEITSSSFLSWSNTDTPASQSITTSSGQDSPLTQASSTTSRHDLIRKTATDNYLNTANK
ncbi:unnamed protein product [Didymodactylos carnosus]|uniref:Integrase catalytic domain-containing protein n=1 Tax=Didymodactylos carnosus TaxID=1234261 RepID=A0A814T7N9_9BILA|nr:unnamed protein product [Didymodactylos carnosus]CAF1156298.1 unnamed protein product [Didymodactylos carnosus]CAF3694207.1 unnamed protein product [Didymodactylos carnosus]CAF3919761.1 unnamed protein product [Didymodactylos carnosus]